MYNLLIKNKKGEEYLSLWWFLILIIIGIGIIGGVLIFYSKSIDVREQEASSLGDKLINCLVVNGRINSVLLEQKQNFPVFEECKLNSVLEDHEHYLEIRLSKDGELVFEPIKIGSMDTGLCELKEQGVKAEYYGNCDTTKTITSEGYLVEIKSGSNQDGVKGKNE